MCAHPTSAGGGVRDRDDGLAGAGGRTLPGEALRKGVAGMAGLTYGEAGVNLDAGRRIVDAATPLAASTRRPGADARLGGFGGLFDLRAAGYRDPVLVSATDGVGTKLRLAMDTGIHDTIGIDCVAMSVNDVLAQGAEPLFFLDYLAMGELDADTGADVIAGIAAGCRTAGCALIGGETAEMPGIYAVGDYDLAGFCVGAAERGTLLPKDTMEAGDILLALASDGIHSNGFSLVRRILDERAVPLDGAAPFAPHRRLADVLMRPTRIYARSVLQAISTGHVKGIAHITGGGLVENVPRIIPDGLAARIEVGSWPMDPVFPWLARDTVDDSEMLRTFNCGVGMVLVVARDGGGRVESTLKEHGETVSVVGALELADGEPRVLFDARHDWLA